MVFFFWIYFVVDLFFFVFEICEELGVDCMLGVVLGKYLWLNDLEFEMLIWIGLSGNL